MILKEIIDCLERLAPPSLQESYDNSGLITGSADMDISAALICLDSTPEVIEEAISKNCNLVIAHHPIIFSGLKKLNGKNYIERAVMLAIKHDIAIYAIHTNLDNVQHGVNMMVAEKLGLKNTSILEPRSGLLDKLVVFVPNSHAELVRQAIFEAGGGHLGNYDQCSFNMTGIGSFRAGNGANPYSGTIGTQHTTEETRIEVILPKWITGKVVKAMKAAHPYEEVAHDIYPLSNLLTNAGSGLLGELEAPLNTITFLQHVKDTLKSGCLKYTATHKQKVQHIAVCGGSGSFLLQQAIAAGADVLVTADFKYHQFFDADQRIIIADPGHYESEQFTIQLLSNWLKAEMPTFATRFTELNTNPVNYL
ncbi:MAG: Nif3-like dinuclear metal center hexameric protein [Flavobacteriales bacterium]